MPNQTARFEASPSVEQCANMQEFGHTVTELKLAAKNPPKGTWPRNLAVWQLIPTSPRIHCSACFTTRTSSYYHISARRAFVFSWHFLSHDEICAPASIFPSI